MEEKLKKLVFGTIIAVMLLVAVATPVFAAEISTSGFVTVNEVISISLGGSLGFGDMTPGTSDKGATIQYDGSPALIITVLPETNVDVDINIKGSSGGTLAIENWKYSSTFAGAKTSIPSTYAETPVYDEVGPGSYAFYHWLTVPTGTKAGWHTALVTYQAVAD